MTHFSNHNVYIYHLFCRFFSFLWTWFLSLYSSLEAINPFPYDLHMWSLIWECKLLICRFNKLGQLNPLPHSLHVWSLIWECIVLTCWVKLLFELNFFPHSLQKWSLMSECTDLTCYCKTVFFTNFLSQMLQEVLILWWTSLTWALRLLVALNALLHIVQSNSFFFSWIRFLCICTFSFLENFLLHMSQACFFISRCIFSTCRLKQLPDEASKLHRWQLLSLIFLCIPSTWAFSALICP